MASSRGEFSSRLGFIMAAAGSAVGLGNIWGFPTQAASNGGAAFLLVYLFLAFTLAYPALMAELIIGRHAHANAVRALKQISNGPITRKFGATTGIVGFMVASLILSFYAIVAGWMIAFCLSSGFELLGMTSASDWLTGFGITRNIVFMLIFVVMTVGIISGGVQEGIERWSSRLMPALLISLVLLVLYVLTLDGAMDGLKVYLLPDFERAFSPKLIIKCHNQGTGFVGPTGFTQAIRTQLLRQIARNQSSTLSSRGLNRHRFFRAAIADDPCAAQKFVNSGKPVAFATSREQRRSESCCQDLVLEIGSGFN